jgi:hypothetical protein
MQFEAAMNGTAYLVVAHKVRTERTNMIKSPADIIIFHQLFFTSLFVVVDVAGESTPVVLIVVVVSVSNAVTKLTVVVSVADIKLIVVAALVTVAGESTTSVVLVLVLVLVGLASFGGKS